MLFPIAPQRKMHHFLVVWPYIHIDIDERPTEVGTTSLGLSTPGLLHATSKPRAPGLGLLHLLSDVPRKPSARPPGSAVRRFGSLGRSAEVIEHVGRPALG